MQTKKTYHCHTNYCGDCGVPMEEMLLKAIAEGYETVGFTAHAPRPYPSHRLSVENMGRYVADVQALKKKYSGKIKIYCGLELEYSPLRHEFFKSLRFHKGIEFAVLGNHYNELSDEETYVTTPADCTPERLEEHLQLFEQALATGWFLYVAHPDLFLNGWRKWDETAQKAAVRIAQACKKAGVPAGYNTKYGYVNHTRPDRIPTHPPFTPFWKIAKEQGCAVHVEIDAHNTDHINPEWVANAERVLTEVVGYDKLVTDLDAQVEASSRVKP